MLDYLKKFFVYTSETVPDDERKLQVATCALFIMMAKADDSFTEDEKDKIISILQTTFDLDEEDVNGLLEEAKIRTNESISLYEFTTVINDNFSTEQKFEIIKNMWRLIYTDNQLDKYEDQLAKRIGGMLNLDFQMIIGAKLVVKEENSRKD